MTHIHLDEAYWCENCQCVTDDAKRCPGCGTELNIQLLSTWIEAHKAKPAVPLSRVKQEMYVSEPIIPVTQIDEIMERLSVPPGVEGCGHCGCKKAACPACGTAICCFCGCPQPGMTPEVWEGKLNEPCAERAKNLKEEL